MVSMKLFLIWSIKFWVNMGNNFNLKLQSPFLLIGSSLLQMVRLQHFEVLLIFNECIKGIFLSLKLLVKLTKKIQWKKKNYMCKCFKVTADTGDATKGKKNPMNIHNLSKNNYMGQNITYAYISMIHLWKPTWIVSRRILVSFGNNQLESTSLDQLHMSLC